METLSRISGESSILYQKLIPFEVKEEVFVMIDKSFSIYNIYEFIINKDFDLGNKPKPKITFMKDYKLKRKIDFFLHKKLTFNEKD